MVCIGKDVVVWTVILSVSELLCFLLDMLSWKSSFLCDAVFLWSVLLRVLEHLGVRLPFGIVKVDAEPEPEVCSVWRFKLEEPSATFWACVPESLDIVECSYYSCWGRCCGLSYDDGHFKAPGRSDPSGCCSCGYRAITPGMLQVQVQLHLGVLEYLGVDLPQGVVVLGAVPVPKVCSGHNFRLEGTCAPGWAGVPFYLDPMGPSFFRCWWSML